MVRHTPYWRVEQGDACVGADGSWTVVRADRPGTVRVTTRFSMGAALQATFGRTPRC
jgi:hypothetical protein